MPTEQLILRRVFPVPVTFADLRRAHVSNMWPFADYPDRWHTAIKEATGALDEVYAVIDGREVRVAIVVDAARFSLTGPSGRATDAALHDLLIKADEAGYWQRPHEVRHDLEESQMSHKTMNRIAANSFIAAGGK